MVVIIWYLISLKSQLLEYCYNIDNVDNISRHNFYGYHFVQSKKC